MNEWMTRNPCGCLKVWLPQGLAFLPCKEHEHLIAQAWENFTRK